MGKYSVKRLRALWDEYKTECREKKTVKTEFCGKTGEFVSAEIPTPIPFSVQGFCTKIGVSRQAWYKVYVHDQAGKYTSLCEQIDMECEDSKRTAFETGILPPKLAGLWMSPYGYTEKVEASVRETDEREKPKAEHPMTIDEKAKLLAEVLHGEDDEQ